MSLLRPRVPRAGPGALCCPHMIFGVDLPDDLIALETVAETERARLTGLSGREWEEQRLRWREAAGRVQAAITAHAEATGENRFTLEAAVKKAVRHADEGPAGG